MIDPTAETYERAIHAKDMAIRKLIIENRRLRADVEHLEEINERLLQLQIEQAERHIQFKEALRDGRRN